MSVLEDDEETQQKILQRNGIVAIVYHVGPVCFSDMDRSLYWQIQCSLLQLPFRITGGMHFCFDDYKIRQLASLHFYYNLARDQQTTRFHLHDGKWYISKLCHSCCSKQDLTPITSKGRIQSVSIVS
jgi:coenzyme F420-reducing hydrogenase beta subunit